MRDDEITHINNIKKIKKAQAQRGKVKDVKVKAT